MHCQRRTCKEPVLAVYKGGFGLCLGHAHLFEEHYVVSRLHPPQLPPQSAPPMSRLPPALLTVPPGVLGHAPPASAAAPSAPDSWPQPSPSDRERIRAIEQRERDYGLREQLQLNPPADFPTHCPAHPHLRTLPENAGLCSGCWSTLQSAARSFERDRTLPRETTWKRWLLAQLSDAQLDAWPECKPHLGQARDRLLLEDPHPARPDPRFGKPPHTKACVLHPGRNASFQDLYCSGCCAAFQRMAYNFRQGGMPRPYSSCSDDLLRVSDEHLALWGEETAQTLRQLCRVLRGEAAAPVMKECPFHPSRPTIGEQMCSRCQSALSRMASDFRRDRRLPREGASHHQILMAWEEGRTPGHHDAPLEYLRAMQALMPPASNARRSPPPDNPCPFHSHHPIQDPVTGVCDICFGTVAEMVRTWSDSRWRRRLPRRGTIRWSILIRWPPDALLGWGDNRLKTLLHIREILLRQEEELARKEKQRDS